MMKTYLLTAAIGLSALFAPQAMAQKKKAPLQKRDRYEFAFELPCYVEQLKQELTYPLAWGHSDITDFNEWRAAARSRVFECMMTPPRRAAAFDMRLEGEEKRKGYTARKISFQINAYARVTAYLLVPDGHGPFPAVNLLHDHGAHLFIGKEKMVRPFGVDTAIVADADRWTAQCYGGRYFGDYLAANGFVVFTTDAPLWGERGRKEGVDRDKYDQIAGNMMMLGRDLCAFMTYDDIAATDFMATLPEVDPKRIGCVGFSMGAYRSWMLAALSDRIKTGVSVCWMITTGAQLSASNRRPENGGFANCIPGLRQWLDYPHIASLACPKPMLFINGSRDKLFPAPGAQEAFREMHQVWDSQKVGNRLETEMWDMPHDCGLEVQNRVLKFLKARL